MVSRVLVFVVLAIVAGGVNAVAFDLELWVDADRTAYLHNTTSGSLSFDGYQIVSLESKSLDVAGWSSIQDQVHTNASGIIAALGAGALGFGEAAPSESQLAELNLAGSGTLQGGAKWSIGKPFGQGGYWVDFFFKLVSGPNAIEAQRVFIPRIPEPSTWLLATLAAGGCWAIRRRR